MDYLRLNNQLKSIASIIFIVGAGVFSVDTLIDYKYKVEFLKQPCQLCRELNPQLETCFKYSSLEMVDPITHKTLQEQMDEQFNLTMKRLTMIYIPPNSYLTGTPNINFTNVTK